MKVRVGDGVKDIHAKAKHEEESLVLFEVRVRKGCIRLFDSKFEGAPLISQQVRKANMLLILDQCRARLRAKGA